MNGMAQKIINLNLTYNDKQTCEQKSKKKKKKTQAYEKVKIGAY